VAVTRRINAVYEGGVLRPLQALDGLDEHTQVRVTIETIDTSGDGIAGCVGTLPDEDAEELRQIVEREFEQVDQNEW